MLDVVVLLRGVGVAAEPVFGSETKVALDRRTCTVRLTMAKVRDAISNVLDDLTIADMAAMSDGSNITVLKRRQSRRTTG